ncbi:hypothetical protein T12_7641 [Trichinella patagoniensis]|uniref:Uncharacterized protein n=1 Tax=Trichinella patagoniensis TaxID=990121 RepID=A0A0V0ZGV5_9BILA|nr:hypothetical protein T12_7641 [Trichinella patagoniensis]
MMVLYPKLQCSVSITVLSRERVNCILFEQQQLSVMKSWYRTCLPETACKFLNVALTFVYFAAIA